MNTGHVRRQVVFPDRRMAAIRTRKGSLASVSQVVPLGVAAVRRLVHAYSAEVHHPISRPDGPAFEDARYAGRTLMRQGNRLRKTNPSTKRVREVSLTQKTKNGGAGTSLESELDSTSSET